MLPVPGEAKTTNLASKAIRIVANKIVSRYIKSFQDIDADGYDPK